jgi:ABC-type sugar transport system substrate-binding protein
MKRFQYAVITATCAATLAFGQGAAFAQAKKTVIGIGQPNVEHPYRVGGINRAKDWATRNPNVELVIADGRRNSAVQLAGLEDLLVRGVDALVISPNDSDALTSIAAAAKAKKVPLIVFDRRLSVPATEYAAYIGADNVAMGRVAGEYLAKATGGKGTIIQLEGTQGASATTDRKKGFEDAMKKFPDIRIVSYVGEYRMAEAVKAMEDGLVAHPNVVAVYAHNDTMAIAANKVLAERGKKGIPVIGMDGAKEGCDAIKDGKSTGSVYYPTMFPEALDIAMKVLRGESVPKETMLDTPLITKDNWSKYCQ